MLFDMFSTARFRLSDDGVALGGKFTLSELSESRPGVFQIGGSSDELITPGGLWLVRIYGQFTHVSPIGVPPLRAGISIYDEDSNMELATFQRRRDGGADDAFTIEGEYIVRGTRFSFRSSNSVSGTMTPVPLTTFRGFIERIG